MVRCEAWDICEFGAYCMRVRRSDGVGGEGKAWCIKFVWLPAVEVAAMLESMAMRSNPMVYWVVGGLLVCRSSIDNPVHMHLLLHRIVRPQ
jgi:hypothetical protein